ncbi:MAG: sugar ABC transporter substrate-binding protein [Actinobacteria bacterium HGW-Actinobacteria-4]|nr:MAG: sugar ABC transporter substrate-binding protein [Actinobacteria bacterium HGW-Actinobacteria-4]
MSTTQKRGMTSAIVATIAAGLITLSACSTNPADTTSPDPGNTDSPDLAAGVDDGTELTLWSRAATEQVTRAFVDAYNATHQNQVNLTIIPTDDFVTTVGGAAGSNTLPDLLSADIVFVPNWTSQGLFADITDRIEALPFGGQVADAHVQAGVWDGKKHVVPHTMDLSVIFWNKDLYAQAGLDPDQGPRTLEELAEHARAVNAVPGDHAGTYFGGNCGGCLVFTWFPSIWAAGAEVMNEAGTEANFTSPQAKAVLDIYRGLVQDGIVLDGTREETGATWVAPFIDGKVGVMPMPNTMLPAALEADFETGVIGIPGPGGGDSTFVGGDGLGISKDSKNVDAAWHFLAWTLTEEAQLDVLAANGFAVARTDLVDNEFAAADARLVTINEVAGKGKTPFAQNFNAAFNAPSSPWIELFRNYVFGDGSTLESDNAAVTAELAR